MTLQEFSVEFDLLYNNISSNQAPGLTEYEKSVFLTQAQEALILDLYKGTTGDSFETTEEVTRYLSSLVKEQTEALQDESGYDPYYIYTITPNTDIFFIVFQSARLTNSRDVMVTPITHDSLLKTLNNPFKCPNKNRVLAISDSNGIHIYSKYELSNFILKYLAIPKPIILEDLEGDLEIRGETTSSNPSLPESLHQQILLRAVQMAKAVWQS